MTVEEERQRLIRIINRMNLPKSGWCLSGSGVMVMHGIQRSKSMGDVDIFCATRLWFDLLAQRKSHGGLATQMPCWEVFTTDPDDPKRRADPPYLYRTMDGLEVNVFSSWRVRGVGDIDVNFWLNNVEYVGNVPCVPLQLICDWKSATGRDKDLHDIIAIRDFMGTNA